MTCELQMAALTLEDEGCIIQHFFFLPRNSECQKRETKNRGIDQYLDFYIRHHLICLTCFKFFILTVKEKDSHTKLLKKLEIKSNLQELDA